MPSLIDIFLKKLFHLPYSIGSRFLLGILLLSLCACENKLAEIEAITQKNLPITSGKDVKLIYSDSAILKFTLKAPVLDRYLLHKDSSYVEFPKGAEVVFFNEDGSEESKITCNYAVQYEKDEKILVRDDVIVVNKLGDQLRTEKLWWHKKEKKIYSDKKVNIKTKDEIIFGEGLESNEDFTKYRILKPIATINIKNEDLP